MRRRVLRQHDVGEALHLLAVAAIPGIARRLRLAVRTIGLAAETDVEVPVVPQPRLNLAEPRAVVSRLAAERLLDGGVHEHAGHARIRRRGLDQRRVRRRPHLGIDVLAVRGDDHRRHHLFAF